MKVLVVEDDARISGFIRRGLKEEGFAVDVASDGEDGLFKAQTNEYDLLILDVMLPKKNGFEILKTLREEGMKCPILILTARDDMRDKVVGLNAGADDYMAKPFGFDEFLARVKALLRRRGDMVATVLKVADLEMDTLRHEVSRAGNKLNLSAREFSLLEYLLKYAGEVVTRTRLSEHVWEHDFDTQSNVIDVHVGRLRKKIDDNHQNKLIHTIRGKGYVVKSSVKE